LERLGRSRMSLFSVLKYQVSNPPTVSEMVALPIEIYIAWSTEFNQTPNPAQFASDIAIVAKGLPMPEYAYQRLLTLIKEYDEPV